MRIHNHCARAGALLLISSTFIACNSGTETFTFLAPLTSSPKFSTPEDTRLLGEISTGSKGDPVRVNETLKALLSG